MLSEKTLEAIGTRTTPTLLTLEESGKLNRTYYIFHCEYKGHDVHLTFTGSEFKRCASKGPLENKVNEITWNQDDSSYHVSFVVCDEPFNIRMTTCLFQNRISYRLHTILKQLDSSTIITPSIVVDIHSILLHKSGHGNENTLMVLGYELQNSGSAVGVYFNHPVEVYGILDLNLEDTLIKTHVSISTTKELAARSMLYRMLGERKSLLQETQFTHTVYVKMLSLLPI